MSPPSRRRAGRCVPNRMRFDHGSVAVIGGAGAKAPAVALRLCAIKGEIHKGAHEPTAAATPRAFVCWANER